MTSRATGLLLAIVLSGVAAAAKLEPAADASQARVGDAVLVTRPSLDSRPAGCRVREIGDLLVEFFDAFNRGDQTALDALFADGGAGRLDFKWFSVTEGEAPPSGRVLRHVAIRDRDQLLPYFAERHQQRETRLLLSVRVNNFVRDGHAGFTYTLRRAADDLREGLGGWQRLVIGKGGVDCARRRIFVWSEGMTMAAPGAALPAGQQLSYCPEPSGWSGRPPLTCSGGPSATARSTDYRFVGGASLRSGCAPAAVSRRLLSIVASFDSGAANARFARGFAPAGVFRPKRGLALRGSNRITQYARARYRDGEGWTAVRLLAPPRADRNRARYRLRVAVSYQGRRISQGFATVTIDCQSGRVLEWVGPNVRISPHAGRVSSFGPVGAAGCDPASPASAIPFVEARGNAPGSQLWALFFEGSWASATEAIFDELVGRELKIVIRTTIASRSVTAIAPDGGVHQPVWGPRPHTGSNWTRPGAEFGVGFFISQPGCWHVRISGGSGSAGDVWFLVRS